MEKFNLKGAHLSCLYYLYKEDSLTAKELSDICDEDKAAISRSIVFLESSGYLKCDSDAKKRYKAPLVLTPAGRELASVIAKKIDEVFDFVGRELHEEDRAVFYRSLELISNKLDDFYENNF